MLEKKFNNRELVYREFAIGDVTYRGICYRGIGLLGNDIRVFVYREFAIGELVYQGNDIRVIV